MTASFESKPERTELSTQDLPTIPTVEEMETWGKEKVLRWIQQRNRNILRGNNLENFNKGCIMGIAFLASNVEFYQICGLPRGVGLALKNLADEVKEDKLSNQTVGRKRKEDEIDVPKPSISPKRSCQEALLSELATRASERRKRIREMITDINGPSDQHSNSVEPTNPLPRAVDQLSDPTFNHELPFPSVLAVVPNRFKVDGTTERNWPYMGRTKFKELLEGLKKVRKSRAYDITWLYGTRGYGKSHLLAALVCYLATQGERVVYIPDCRTWLRDPVGCIRAAMLFAWADDITTQKEIMTLNTEDEIETFFKCQKNVIVVVDQLNALTESNSSNEETKERVKLRTWLMRFTLNHTAVFSSTANYKEYLNQSPKQTSNYGLKAYGGLDRTEMEQWWKRYSDIDMGGYKRSEVEDITGCIPLLLDKCVVGRKIDLTVADLREIYYKAVGFVHQIITRTEGRELTWQWYTESVKACFSHQEVPSGWLRLLDLIDHRYFYRRDNGTGGYTCGLVRDAVAEQLLMRKVNFADTDFLASLPEFITNPSVTGFIIEKAVLSSIASHGLAIGAEIREPMEIRLFADLFNIAADITGEPVLYCPEKFNHEAIDGIIVFIEPDRLKKNKHLKKYVTKTKNVKEDNKEENEEDKKKDKKQKQKLFIFPLRITVALETHSDSHAKFFERYYDRWAKGLSDFDVEPQFLWITPDRRDVVKHEACDQWPQHDERFIHLKDVNEMIWWKYQDAKGDTG